MKLKDLGFRSIYHNFCIIALKSEWRNALRNFPGVEKANWLLTYGYIDYNAGLTLETLACVSKESSRYKASDTTCEWRFFIRAGAIENDEILPLEHSDTLYKRYAEKIDALSPYNVGEEIEKTRNMTFLDACRNISFPDDILVVIVKNGLGPEGCWARLCGFGENCLLGILLNEPDQNYGCHENERIRIHVHQNDDGSHICFSDMDRDGLCG